MQYTKQTHPTKRLRATKLYKPKPVGMGAVKRLVVGGAVMCLRYCPTSPKGRPVEKAQHWFGRCWARIDRVRYADGKC